MAFLNKSASLDEQIEKTKSRLEKGKAQHDIATDDLRKRLEEREDRVPNAAKDYVSLERRRRQQNARNMRRAHISGNKRRYASWVQSQSSGKFLLLLGNGHIHIGCDLNRVVRIFFSQCIVQHLQTV